MQQNAADGLAYMEGNMRGPSTQDCEKSFARTGHESVNLRAKRATPPGCIPLAQLRTAKFSSSATEPALASH